MAELIDRHEFRLALEAEERAQKQMFRRQGKEGYTALVTAFFEVIYRLLNKAKSVKIESTDVVTECSHPFRYSIQSSGDGERNYVRQNKHCPDCGAALGGSDG